MDTLIVNVKLPLQSVVALADSRLGVAFPENVPPEVSTCHEPPPDILPETSIPDTPLPEAVSFITPVVVQDLYSNGKISTDEAEAMSSYAVSNSYQGEIVNAVQAQVDQVFVQQQLMSSIAAAAYISIASEAILEDMEIVALVAV